MAKAKSLNIFYAYPSNPPDIGEGIEYVCKLLNASNLVKAITWKDADIVGLRVIRQVTRKIDSCDIFCCDLTYLNMNVLFELGYAISKNKRIFISSNTDIKGQHERFTSIVPIASIGYQG
ncbi:hypothetical protein, partial [Deinococcus saxicola]|uniref:hypothetical protein n=1 Tax=Deinococcus saxicola TaxID=249406 RepID=UPI003D11EF8C